jgi:hypothetical protein
MIRFSTLQEKIKHADWSGALQKNKYALASLVVGATYLYISFLAISFIVTSAQRAFTIDEQAAQSSVVTFDIASYEKIKHRLNEN